MQSIYYEFCGIFSDAQDTDVAMSVWRVKRSSTITITELIYSLLPLFDVLQRAGFEMAKRFTLAEGPPAKKVHFEPVQLGAVPTLEEMDMRTLHFQNRKLAQRFVNTVKHAHHLCHCYQLHYTD